MLDVGWTEILVIAIVLIIVVGPKDLPQMLRTFGRMVAKMRGMAGDFRQQFDEALREADLDDVRKTIGEAQKLNPLNTIRDAVNPLRQMGDEIKADLHKSTSFIATPTPSVNPSESVSSAPAAAVASEAGKPASSEPVAAVPLKAGPVSKTVKKKADDDGAAKVAKPRKAAMKAEAEPKKASTKVTAAKKAAPAKSETAKTKTAKTKKGEA